MNFGSTILICVCYNSKTIHCWPLKLQHQEGMIFRTSKSHDRDWDMQMIKISSHLDDTQEGKTASEALHKRKVVQWISHSNIAL